MWYHWLGGHTTICKFVPHVCQAILAEFQDEYLRCPTIPDKWKRVEERFRTRWNVHHTLGTLRNQRNQAVTITTTRVFFSGDASPGQCRIQIPVDRWIDCGSSSSSSDAQNFNRSDLREIKDDSLGLPPPEPLGEGGPDLHDFFLCDDAFALIPWNLKPFSRRQLTREERIVNYRRVVENAFGILVSRFKVLLGTMAGFPHPGESLKKNCFIFKALKVLEFGQN